MNKRQIKKFCKKGGHYHFDKTIKRISHKKMMYPYVAIAYVNNHCISWHEIGTCLTCAKCTDVNIDWNGTPYMCWGDNCGGSDNFTCKRYKLNPNIKFFKYMDIKSTSPDSELKRYIEESIKNSHKDNEPDSDEPPFISNDYTVGGMSIMDYIEEQFKNITLLPKEPKSDQPFSITEAERNGRPLSERCNTCNIFSENPEADLLSKLFGDVYCVKLDTEDLDKMISALHEVDYGIPVIYPNFDGVYPDFDGDILPKEE